MLQGLVSRSDAVLFPVNQANVTSKISAPVRRILVNRGDHVKAGQLLAELESRDLVASAEESKSQLDQAQAALQTTSAATVPEDVWPSPQVIVAVKSPGAAFGFASP